MTTSIADWRHVKSWEILCSLWRGSRAERENKRARRILAREYYIRVVKVFNDPNDFSDFKILLLRGIVHRSEELIESDIIELADFKHRH